MILRIDQITHTGRQKVGGLATVPGGFPTVPGRLARDGARIYFSDIVEGHAAPMVVPAAGGEALPIPMPFKDATVLDITPDGSDLDVGAMTSPDFDYTLWRVSVLGGSPRRVGDLVVNDFGETPDGRGILFEKGSDIYFARADGTNARKLLSVSGWAFPPIYSPWIVTLAGTSAAASGRRTGSILFSRRRWAETPEGSPLIAREAGSQEIYALEVKLP